MTRSPRSPAQRGKSPPARCFVPPFASSICFLQIFKRGSQCLRANSPRFTSEQALYRRAAEHQQNLAFSVCFSRLQIPASSLQNRCAPSLRGCSPPRPQSFVVIVVPGLLAHHGVAPKIQELPSAPAVYQSDISWRRGFTRAMAMCILVRRTRLGRRFDEPNFLWSVLVRS